MENPRRERLHFLDWLRTVLVCLVVYAHLVFCGAQIGRPEDSGAPDDHAYAEHPSNLLAVRWIAVARQWCIPLLFWVSGASHALSFAASGLGKQLRKVAILTACGVAPNAFSWLAGPRDELCSFRRPCPRKGLLFDFTEDPYSGSVEPYVNQMWYTVMLMLLMPLNWPLLKACVEPRLLAVQWAVHMLLYGALIIAAGSECPSPWVLIVGLAALEALFLFLVPKAAGMEDPWPWFPLRAWQYLCAAAAVLQVGVLPIARVPVVNDITPSYALYLFISCSRWFQMGFLMTRPGIGSTRSCEPLASKAWPLVLVLLVLCWPSTSWSMAGVLPYPLLPKVLDQTLYVSGTFLVFFVVDRCGRHLPCQPLPSLLAEAALVLYLMQVFLITLLLQVLKTWVRGTLGSYPGTGDRATALTVLFLLAASISLVAAALLSLLRSRRTSVGAWGSVAAEEMSPRDARPGA